MLTGRDDPNFYCQDIKDIALTYEDIYNHGPLCKVLRRSSLLNSFALNDWKTRINSYDLVFAIDSNISLTTLEWICRHRGNSKVILYFRNKLSHSNFKGKADELKQLPLEIWSYNIHDCEKYGFRYNSQVINRELFDLQTDGEPKYSACFVGSNKGRDETLSHIQELLQRSSSFGTYFYMPGDTKHEWNRCTTGAFLPYAEYLKIASESLSIIDLVSSENKGLTFRPLEALFLGKKLITNYEEIIRYDFYRPQNIFILGKDSERDLSDFLSSTCIPVEKSIIDSYTTDFWIRRFIGSETDSSSTAE